jgi:hypothetical protein
MLGIDWNSLLSGLGGHDNWLVPKDLGDVMAGPQQLMPIVAPGVGWIAQQAIGEGGENRGMPDFWSNLFLPRPGPAGSSTSGARGLFEF